MQEYLLIDGYNIINNWPHLVKIKDYNLELARTKLIEILQNYQGMQGNNIIVVFDAHMSKSKTRTTAIEGKVRVFYSKKGETADALIEKMIGELPQRSKITVVTNDWDEQMIILGKGALRMTARELLYNINNTEEMASSRKVNINSKNKSIEEHLHEKIKKQLEELRHKAPS